MINKIKTFFLYRKYRKKIKEKKTITFRVAQPLRFLQRLEDNGIEYISLRWPEETSAILAGDRFEGADIDILVRVGSWKEIFYLTCDLLESVNAIKFDVYSHPATKGLLYRGMPYYPHHICEELFASKFKNNDGFYCTKGEPYIKSLVYHLVYHKGESSGIPLWEGGTEKIAKRAYGQLLRTEAQKHGVLLPESLNIRSLYLWLQQREYGMPYDLLIRYPVNDDANLAAIKQWEEEQFKDISNEKYLYVFMLRDGIENTEYEEIVLTSLGQYFVIKDAIRIEPAMRRALKKKIRGGNWYEKTLNRETLPYLFVIAEDSAPEKLITPDKLYPLIDNKNFYKKLIIREKVEKISGLRSNCIHGTDNLKETAYVLDVLKKMNLYE